jgi:hypothetical protein
MSEAEVQELTVKVARLEEQIKALSDRISLLSAWMAIIGSGVLVAAIKIIFSGKVA